MQINLQRKMDAWCIYGEINTYLWFSTMFFVFYLFIFFYCSMILSDVCCLFGLEYCWILNGRYNDSSDGNTVSYYNHGCLVFLWIHWILFYYHKCQWLLHIKLKYCISGIIYHAHSGCGIHNINTYAQSTLFVHITKK